MNNKNNERSSFPEDVPHMRSMQIRSVAPAVMMPPPVPIAKKSIVSVRAPKLDSKLGTTWDVGALAPVPPIYVLERTNILVDDSSQNVANRIMVCLRKESIAAKYHNEEAFVEAETENHVEFTVRLWQGRNGQVLVEVQKVSGCCFLYCQAAKAVLRAAKGMQAPAKRRTFSIPPCVARVEPKQSEEEIRESLEVAGNLLKQDQLDCHQLAIESLMLLSRATENQCFTARCILSGEFREVLLSLIASFHMSGAEDRLSDFDREHIKIMHRYALTVFANCLASLHKSGDLVEVLEQQETLSSRSLLLSLVEDLAAAIICPHNACQAAICLYNLIASSDETKREACDLGTAEVISTVSQIGACRHTALEEACTKLQTLLL